MKFNSNIYGIVSPVNKNYKSKSNIDYREQIDRGEDGMQIMWDDAKGNPTKKKGGYFAFVHNGNRVNFYMIIDIKTKKQRLATWKDNCGQKDRNVIYLSQMFMSMAWSEWLMLGGPLKVQGTARVVSAHRAIVDRIKELFPNLGYCSETGELFLI